MISCESFKLLVRSAFQPPTSTSMTKFDFPRPKHGLRAAALALAFSAVLVGCGDSSSSSVHMDEEPGGMTPPGSTEETAETQRMDVQKYIRAARAAVNGLTDMSSDDEVATAEQAINDAQEKIDDKSNMLPSTEVEGYTNELAMLKTDLEDREESIEMAMEEAAEQQREAERVAMNEARLAMNAMVMPVAEAISNENYEPTGDVDPDTALHQTELPDSLENESLTTQGEVVDRDDDANITTITLKDVDGFALNAMDTMAPARGWTAKKFSFEDNTGKGAVFTNLGGPDVQTKTKKYDNFFSINPDNDTTNAGTPMITGLTAKSGTTGQLVFTTNIVATSDHTIKATDFVWGDLPERPPTETAQGEAKYDSPFANDSQEDRSFDISFLGVSGKLECPESNECKVRRWANDAITFTGNPTFTPGDDIEEIDVTRTTTTEDEDYITFGYWMTKMMDGSEASYEISTFADAKGYRELDPSESNNVGKATYSGGAAGIYVLKTGDLADPSLHDGEFVANVKLTAQFGQEGGGKVPVNDEWTITGMVNNFRSATAAAEHDLSGWNLELSRVDLAESRNDDGVAQNPQFFKNTGFEGTTSGGSTEGVWNGTFFGNSSEIADSTDGHPEAIIGEFNGHFNNGHVAGAYGAEKDD